MRSFIGILGVFLFATFNLPAAQLEMDAFNTRFTPAFLIYDSAVYNVGWYYSPSHTYQLEKIETHFRSGTGKPEDVDRDVMFKIYTDRPAAGGQLLATE